MNKFGADGGIRTHKPVEARDFKSLVYTIPPHRRIKIKTYFWRPRAESNRRIRVLQTPALPLGYVAVFNSTLKSSLILAETEFFFNTHFDGLARQFYM